MRRMSNSPPPSTSHLFCFVQLIVELCSPSASESKIASLIQSLGYVTTKSNPSLAYQYAKLAVDSTDYDILKGKHIQVFMEDLEEADPVKELPRQLVMVRARAFTPPRPFLSLLSLTQANTCPSHLTPTSPHSTHRR